MSTVLKFRRGDTTTSNAFTGAEGELFVDTTKDTLVVHDGVTAGGKPLATESYVTSGLSGKADSSSLATVATSGSYNDLTNKPTLFSGSYNDLINIPQSLSITDEVRFGQINVGIAGLLETIIYNDGISINGEFVATESYVTTQISDLIGGAPSALDTLNELAAALNDDSNFASTITTSLSGKADSSSLATVATSGSYNDLTNKPTVPDLNAVSEINFVVGTDQITNIISYSTTILTASTQTIDSFDSVSYRTAKYLLQATSATGVHVVEFLVTHNDVDTFDTVSSNIDSGSSLFTIDSSIVGTDVVVTVTTAYDDIIIDFTRTNLIARPLATLEGDLSILSGTEDLLNGTGTVDLNV